MTRPADGREGPRWLASLLLLGVAFFTHRAALDFATIETEDFVRMFSGAGPAGAAAWGRLFTPEYFAAFHQNHFYRPLVSACYRLGWELFGWRLEPYQGLKLLLLWGSTLLLYELALAWGVCSRFALAAGLFYAAHSLHAGYFTRLSFLDDPLLTLFSLLALLGHARWLQGRLSQGLAAFWIAAACWAALLAKESALLLPLLVGAQEAAWEAAPNDARRNPNAVYGSLLLVVLLHLLLVAWVGGGSFAALGWSGENLLATLRRAAHYLGGFWGFGAAEEVPAALLALGLVGLASLSGSRRLGWFCAAWLALGLAPYLNIVVTPALNGYFGCVDCGTLGRMSMPLAGYCLLLGLLLQSASASGRAGSVGAAVLAVSFLAVNAQRVRAVETTARTRFADEVEAGTFLAPEYVFKESRFSAVLVTLPHLRRLEPRAYAAVLARVRAALPGHTGPTIADLFASERIYADVTAYSHLSEALSHKGFLEFHRDLARAGSGDRFVARVEEASRLKDEGVALFQGGDAQAAIGRFRESLALNPDNLYTLMSLGTAYAATDRREKAAQVYERALRLRQEQPTLYAELLGARADALGRKGHGAGRANAYAVRLPE